MPGFLVGFLLLSASAGSPPSPLPPVVPPLPLRHKNYTILLPDREEYTRVVELTKPLVPARAAVCKVVAECDPVSEEDPHATDDLNHAFVCEYEVYLWDGRNHIKADLYGSPLEVKKVQTTIGKAHVPPTDAWAPDVQIGGFDTAACLDNLNSVRREEYPNELEEKPKLILKCEYAGQKFIIWTGLDGAHIKSKVYGPTVCACHFGDTQSLPSGNFEHDRRLLFVANHQSACPLDMSSAPSCCLNEPAA